MDGARGPHHAWALGPPLAHTPHPLQRGAGSGHAGTRSYGRRPVPLAGGPRRPQASAQHPLPPAPSLLCIRVPLPRPNDSLQPSPWALGGRQRAGRRSRGMPAVTGTATRCPLTTQSGHHRRAEPVCSDDRGGGSAGPLAHKCEQRGRDPRVANGAREAKAAARLGSGRHSSETPRLQGEEAPHGWVVAFGPPGPRPHRLCAGGSLPDRHQCPGRPPACSMTAGACRGHDGNRWLYPRQTSPRASGVRGPVSCGHGGRRPERALGTRDSVPWILLVTVPEPP